MHKFQHTILPVYCAFYYNALLRIYHEWSYTVEPVLRDCRTGHKYMVSQGRWSLVTGSIALKYETFCQKHVVLQDRWSPQQWPLKIHRNADYGTLCNSVCSRKHLRYVTLTSSLTSYHVRDKIFVSWSVKQRHDFGWRLESGLSNVHSNPPGPEREIATHLILWQTQCIYTVQCVQNNPARDQWSVVLLPMFFSVQHSLPSGVKIKTFI